MPMQPEKRAKIDAAQKLLGMVLDLDADPECEIPATAVAAAVVLDPDLEASQQETASVALQARSVGRLWCAVLRAQALAAEIDIDGSPDTVA